MLYLSGSNGRKVVPMAKTLHRPARIERDGFAIRREPRRPQRRTGTRRAVIAAELRALA
jgi:hypothetical protein